MIPHNSDDDAHASSTLREQVPLRERQLPGLLAQLAATRAERVRARRVRVALAGVVAMAAMAAVLSGVPASRSLSTHAGGGLPIHRASAPERSEAETRAAKGGAQSIETTVSLVTVSTHEALRESSRVQIIYASDAELTQALAIHAPCTSIVRAMGKTLIHSRCP